MFDSAIDNVFNMIVGKGINNLLALSCVFHKMILLQYSQLVRNRRLRNPVAAVISVTFKSPSNSEQSILSLVESEKILNKSARS